MNISGDPVFIHIPRTGGNSILMAIEGKAVRIVHHVYKEDLSVFGGRFVFSFVRDPADRVISAYAYLLHGGLSDDDKNDSEKYVRCFKNFSEFVFNGLENAAAEQRHFKPQSFWITNNEGVVVPNFLGRTETLQESFDLVCERAGWEKSKIGTINSSDREGFECTDKMTDVIKKIYAEDYMLITDLFNKNTNENS